jgi:hypothetical protein
MIKIVQLPFCKYLMQSTFLYHATTGVFDALHNHERIGIDFFYFRIQTAYFKSCNNCKNNIS